MKADLHTHTNASDGKLSPDELIRKAAHLEIEAIAITDHDTVEGIIPALVTAKEFPQLTFIPGIEISAETLEGEAHILGYFLDYNNSKLKQTLNELRNARFDRGYKMVNNLASIDVNIDWERVQELAGVGGSVGRPHIAEALLERGYVSSFREAFTKYIGRGCPGYAARKKVNPVEAIELILDADGIPVLAHPGYVKQLDTFIIPLADAGLKGIEVYFSGYSTNMTDQLLDLAKKHNLVATGGSDFHGIDDNVGGELGSIDLPREALEKLISLSKQ